MQCRRSFWAWLVLVSLLSLALLLSACSETSLATPTISAEAARPSGAATAIPAINSTTTTSANKPTASAAHPTNNASSPTPTQPAPASLGVGPSAGFYQLPYANSEFFIHIPNTLKVGQPAQVVVALHGMGGDGQQFGTPLIAYADRYNFVLVAPDLKFDENYFDPNHVAANDSVLLPELDGLLAALPTQTHIPINPKVLLFGFSRGAQIAHRFAFFYPEKVLGVAAMSAGNWTLPELDIATSPAKAAAKVSLPFPFGVADLANYSGRSFNLTAVRQISFWLGVGGADNALKDVPPAWNAFLGQTRLERATRFHQALQSAGINATLTIFPGVAHSVCTEMKQQAFAFFGKLVA